MKLAVTYENGKVFEHFGHTKELKVYEIFNDEITNSEVISTNGNGHSALVGFLKDLKIDILICGGIGTGAVNALNDAGIKLIAGQAGDTDLVVDNFIKGKLDLSKKANCNHHHSNEGCGEHTCH